MRRLTSFIKFLVPVFLTCAALAQGTPSTATATCSFDADKELTANYQRISFNLKKPVFGREIPYGKAWAQGGNRREGPSGGCLHYVRVAHAKAMDPDYLQEHRPHRQV